MGNPSSRELMQSSKSIETWMLAACVFFPTVGTAAGAGAGEIVSATVPYVNEIVNMISPEKMTQVHDVCGWLLNGGDFALIGVGAMLGLGLGAWIANELTYLGDSDLAKNKRAIRAAKREEFRQRNQNDSFRASIPGHNQGEREQL